MKTLDEIAIEHGTDKATKHPTGAHGYTPFYQMVFESRRSKPIKVLEIGVGGGESIRTWLDYFTNAKVVGVDLVKETNVWNDPKASPGTRYRFYSGDQANADFWRTVVEAEGGFDVIIDDGGHRNDQIFLAFISLWSSLLPGGLYCIEDIGVCYSPGSVFVVPGCPAHNDFLKTKLDEVLKDTHGIDWMTLCKELAIIHKRE